jgi:outer membrane protein assembly factor BamB
MTYALGIDIGTTYTAAAVARGGRAEIVALGYRATSVPTVVFLGEDAKFLVGEAAERRASTSPDRVAREFKRRVGDPTPLLLGGSPIAVDRCLAEVLRWVVQTVSETEGQPPAALTVTHPANWGEFKRDVLRQAVNQSGLPQAGLLPEPVAAATWYAQAERLAPGCTVAVYDLGGGTFDASVLRRRTDGGFETLGRAEGIERLGGIDIDQAVFAYVVRSAGPDLAGLASLGPDHDGMVDDPAVVAATANLRRACIEAKEALSAETSASIPVWFPDLSHNVLLHRSELEELIWPLLSPTIDAMSRVVAQAGITPADLDAVLLVGGSSRVPLVSRQVSAGLERPVVVDAHPKHPVAMGAALDAYSRAAATPPSGPAGAVGPAGTNGNGGHPTPGVSTLLPTPIPVPIPVPSGPYPQPGQEQGHSSGGWQSRPGHDLGPGSGPRHAVATAASSGPDRRLLTIAGAALVAVLVVVALIATREMGGSDDTATGDDGSETPLVPGGQGDGEDVSGSGDASQARFAWQADLSEETIGDVTAVDGERAYIVDSRGLLTAFDLATGEQAWQKDLGDESTGANPLRAGDLLVVGISEPEATYGLDPATGNEVWKAPDVWLPQPVVAGEVVIDHVGTTITGVNLADGTVRWERLVEELWAWGNVAVVGGVAVTGSDEGLVGGFRPDTGDLLWTTELPRGEVSVDAIGPLGGDAVAVVDYDGFVTAYDVATGAVRWNQDLGASSAQLPLTIDGKLVVQADGGITFLDPASGTTTGTYGGPGAAGFAAAPDGSPTLLVMDTSTLGAIDMAGELLWSTDLPLQPFEIEVAEGAALVHDFDGKLAVFELTL